LKGYLVRCGKNEIDIAQQRFVGPCPHRDKDYITFDPTFGRFTLLEPVSH
jgi:hypothetical protein